jgi:hypothetical protein
MDCAGPRITLIQRHCFAFWVVPCLRLVRSKIGNVSVRFRPQTREPRMAEKGEAERLLFEAWPLAAPAES